MYNIIYMGGIIEPIFKVLVNAENIKMLGVILDCSMKEDCINNYRQILKSESIKEYCIDDIPMLNPDMILVPYFTKQIKSDLLNRYIFVNIHAGILPKWRGFNSNCWAILNGENIVGYTLHRVREELDAGEIYTVIETQLEEQESYAVGRERIIGILCSKLENIIINIIEGKIIPKPQDAKGIIYNCKLRVSDSYIVDWNRKSSWFYNLMRVFDVKTGGSGIHIVIKEKEYVVYRMEIAKEINDSVGISGAVINKRNDGSVLIKTLDNAIWINELRTKEGNIVIPTDILKIGMRI